MQPQYPSNLVCLSIEAARRTLLRRVQSLLAIVSCPGWSTSRGQPRGRAWERSSLNSSNRFPLNSWARLDSPGDVPTRTRQAGDEAVPNRIAILRHDYGNRGRRFLDGTGCCGTTRDDYSTLSRTSSAASAERRSRFPSADRHSMTMLFPSTYPSSRRPCRNASARTCALAERESAVR